MDWLHQKLLTKPNLKIILVHGADPADPPSTFMFHAINSHLVRDRPDLGSRIAFYETVQAMHGKITIIDDIWAVIGSANAFRRSMYTDGECSIAILDENPVSFAKKLRANLWWEHAGADPGVLDILIFGDLDDNLSLWNSAWGPPISFKLVDRFERKDVPFVVCDRANGTVTATKNSEIVKGQDTNWGSNLVNQLFKVIGEEWIYRIVAVDSPTQLRIKLLKDLNFTYQGSTGSGKTYLLQQPAKWLLDELPAFDGVAYAQSDADSRLDY